MFKRCTKNARKDSHMQSLVRASVYEDDIYEDREHHPSLYVYYRAVHSILKNRGVVQTWNTQEFRDWLYARWMADVSPVAAANKWEEYCRV